MQTIQIILQVLIVIGVTVFIGAVLFEVYRKQEPTELDLVIQESQELIDELKAANEQADEWIKQKLKETK